MPARGRARSAAEHALPAHELAIILADRAFGRLEAGIGAVRTAGPFPHIAEEGRAVGRRARLDRPSAVELVAPRRIIRCSGGFPFCLGRQARARPARISVGLVKTDVRNRGRRIDRAAAIEPEARPPALAPLPIERRGNPLGAHPGPAIGQPVPRILIAAIGDEIGPFAIGDGTGRQRMRAEQRRMTRPLAIEREIVAHMPDLGHRGSTFDPAKRPRHFHRHFPRRGPDRGLDRVLRHQMQHIGNQQFLMLLLMMAAKRHQIARGLRQIGQYRNHCRVDMRAIRDDFVERRARHHPAPPARMALALRLVITVEQERETIIVQRVAAHEIAQHEGFEEPGRMRQMPFGGRRIVHRLDRGVGIGQRRNQRHRQRAYRLKARS